MDRKDGTVIIKVHEALLFTGDILRIAKRVAENGVNSNILHNLINYFNCILLTVCFLHVMINAILKDEDAE